MSKLHRVNDELVAFHCPGCDGIHQVKVANGGWHWNGSMNSPTFQPSVKVTYPANPNACEQFKEWRTERICHSFVTNGRIQFLDDCSHALRGQTVEIPEWPT